MAVRDVGNRGFFPHHLAKTGAKKKCIRLAKQAGLDVVVLGQRAKSKVRKRVETYDEARRCASCFKQSGHD